MQAAICESPDSDQTQTALVNWARSPAVFSPEALNVSPQCMWPRNDRAWEAMARAAATPAAISTASQTVQRALMM